MDKKILFFDIDGTLYEYGVGVPESTVRAIRKCRENGHKAFLCTGRSKVMIPQEPILNIGFDGMVAACGAYVEIDGKVCHNATLPPEVLAETLKRFREYLYGIILEGPVNLFYDEECMELLSEEWFIGFIRETIGDLFVSIQSIGVDELEKIGQFHHRLPVNKLSARIDKRSFDEAVEPLLGYYDVIRHDVETVEMVPKGYSKATGIKTVCDFYQTDVRNTIAVGDGMNDIDMLDYAGAGIAMGNGTKTAKEHADYVTKPIHEDGIYLALAHYGVI